MGETKIGEGNCGRSLGIEIRIIYIKIRMVGVPAIRIFYLEVLKDCS